MRGGRPLSARLLRVLVPVIVVVQLTATADVPVRPAVAAVIRTAPVTAYAAPPQPAYPPGSPADAAITPSLGTRQSMSGQGPDWLDEINLYRTAAGLAPVAEEPTWTAALLAHFTYLTHTPPSYLTGQYANVHMENPASPYYTAAGDQAGRASHLSFGFEGSPVAQIDGWLLAPVHVVGILRPGLERVAFAQDPNSSWSGLNVGSGLNGQGSASAPILFPGPGISTNLTGWLVNEVPNPLETCGWQNQLLGPALVAMLPADPAAGLTATLVADSGPDFSTANGNLCVVDMHTYMTTDTVYGPAGASILSGQDHPVFLIPSAPLTWSRYHATMRQPGKPDIAWSFIATPPRQPFGFESVALHVTDTGADTVIGNLTVTGPTATGYTTVYPCLEGRPHASNNNFLAGQTIPNLVVAHPDSNGDICLYTTTPAHLIWDQVAETDAFSTHVARRLIDTRFPAGRL
jgi:hypothetical protein